jgi:hypothetical protein
MHRRGLRVHEPPPCRVSAPRRRRRDPQRLEDPANRGRTDSVTELQQLTPDPLLTRPWFSVASRPVSAAISALTGGRPAWFG